MMTFAVIRSPVLMKLQNCSINWGRVVALITVHSGREKQQTSSLIKGSKWVPKALPNFQQIVGVEEYCFNMMSHKKNLHSVYIYVSTDIRRSTRPIRSQQTVTKVGKKRH